MKENYFLIDTQLNYHVDLLIHLLMCMVSKKFASYVPYSHETSKKFKKRGDEGYRKKELNLGERKLLKEIVKCDPKRTAVHQI